MAQRRFDRRDGLHRNGQHDQDGVSGKGKGEFSVVVAAGRTFRRRRTSPRQQDAHTHTGQAGAEGGNRPETEAGQAPLHAAHHHADEEDRAQVAPQARPAAGHVRRADAPRQAGQPQHRRRIRGQDVAAQAGRGDERLEGRSQRAEGGAPGVTERGNQNGGCGREADGQEQRGDDGHRHAEAAHALQEGTEHPAQQEGLHHPIRRAARQLLAQHVQGAGLVGHPEQEQGRPDDEQHVQGHQEGLALSDDDQVGASAKPHDGHGCGDQPADAASDQRTFPPADHHDEHHQHRRSCQ